MGRAADITAGLNINGYNDWFIPSTDELLLIFQNLHLRGIGGFASRDYWSSEQLSGWLEYNPGNNARTFFFGNGRVYNQSKDSWNLVRPVRAF